jgi:hypothetical protein
VSEQAIDAGATCAQCSKTLTPDDRVVVGDRAFCRACHASLRAELERAVADQSADVNYINAGVGAVLGGTVGALVWWGFTAATKWSVGLLAVAIGFLVGHGAVRFAGGKRSGGLQALSIGVSLVSYVCATYLVNATFINRAYEQGGDAFRIGFTPQSLDMFLRVITVNFGVMDLVFLAIAIYEAWKIPKPFKLPPSPAG